MPNTASVERSTWHLRELFHEWRVNRQPALRPAAPPAAPHTPYEDVPVGAWYEEAVNSLFQSGALDAAHALFRPNDAATRAEMARLVVAAAAAETDLSALVPHFNDVPSAAWYFAGVEEAARLGW